MIKIAVILSLFYFVFSQTCFLTHDQAMTKCRAAKIGISSSRGCYDRNTRGCTSLTNIRCKSIEGLVAFKTASQCDVTITGGTEVGHSGGQYSHWNGYKIDFRINPCVDGYIKRSFAYIGRRGDGAEQYRSSSGNVYAREGDHWDVTWY